MLLLDQRRARATARCFFRGRLAIYEAKGDFQLNAISAEPAGLGALQLAFEQLKQRLADEGLFHAARKRPIPMLPQRIAIVTSPSGAAIRDILNILGRRYDGLAVQIYPVRVQGPTAAREIAAAVRHLSRWQMHDVVLICRGGGSLEDLWAFNEEIVARAVANCTIPTISGISRAGYQRRFLYALCNYKAPCRTPGPGGRQGVPTTGETAWAHRRSLKSRRRSTSRENETGPTTGHRGKESHPRIPGDRR